MKNHNTWSDPYGQRDRTKAFCVTPLLKSNWSHSLVWKISSVICMEDFLLNQEVWKPTWNGTLAPGLISHQSNICQKQFIKKSTWEYHLNIHLKKNLICNECKGSIPSLLLFKRHRSKHKITCGQSGETFKSTIYLQNHKKRHELKRAGYLVLS